MKRRIAFILLAAMLSAGCRNTAAPSSETEAETEISAFETETETEDSILDDLPDTLNYNGYTFNIFTFSGGNTGTTNKQYLTVEDMTGEIVNDAAYQRNSEVEDRLNIAITCLESADPNHPNQSTELKQYVTAGDTSIDLCVMFANNSIHDLVLNNVLYDISKMKYVDTDKDYYDHNFIDTFSLCGSQYIMAGSYPYTSGPSCFFIFNKDEWKNRSLEDAYGLVYDGKWTHDKLMELINGTYTDKNGDGNYDDNDFYGLDTVGVVMRAFCPCYGASVMTVNGTEYTVNVANEESFGILEKIVALASDPNVHLGSGDRMWANFMEGNSLMMYYGSGLYRLRDIEFDFGYLPTPKLNEEQEDYISYKLCYPVCIPSNVTDPDRTGAVCEALFSTSEKYMTDAFIDTYVENKILRDEDSQKLYRMSMTSGVYDFSSYYQADEKKIADFMLAGNLIAAKSTDIASSWRSIEKVVTRAFNKFFEEIEKNLAE